MTTGFQSPLDKDRGSHQFDNDGDGSDDEGMTAHYALLQPFIDQINAYISANPSFSHVYVTGHSLGAAMAQRFMWEHLGDSRFEAVTFASPGYETFSDVELGPLNITNYLVDGDPILFTEFGDPSRYGNGGQTYIVSHPEVTGDPPTLHSMELYLEVARLISRLGDTAGNYRLNISYDASGWHISLPSGSVSGTDLNDLLRTANTTDSLFAVRT